VAGTWNLCTAAVENDVSTFVMISSDKAVRPTNVMGASKRAAELVVGSFASEGKTKFVSVRFGNVLGSNGSVVPIFKAQIAAGGPVTVTHPEVRRYFMTVREAVQLVLQASTMGRDSEVYVLDMGQPVRILDLARNLIRLAGLVPEQDIHISFVGLRPGEKLYEELIIDGEETFHKKIHILKSPAPDRAFIVDWMQELRAFLDKDDAAAVVAHLTTLIPEYTISERWDKAIARRREAHTESGVLPEQALRAAI
jgi:FlaA1/EpsC-like NDP-sugar epimerase